MSHSFQVTFDAIDPARLADFWGEALGYRRPEPPKGYDTWQSFLQAKGIPEEEWDRADALIDPDGDGPRLYFQKVPETKTVKNRVHLDINIADRTTDAAQRRLDINREVERVVGLGATQLEDFDENDSFVWTVMSDPEGNEFCIH
jgi:hypothetical protein